MSSAIITSRADWLRNIVIIYQNDPSSVAPAVISPVISTGASVASLKCEVSGVRPAVQYCRPAIIKVLIYWFWSPDLAGWLAGFSVLDQATMQAELLLQTRTSPLNEELQSWILYYLTTTTGSGTGMLAINLQDKKDKNFDRDFYSNNKQYR